MKTIFRILGVLIFTSVMITSCGGSSSVERDAKKVAEVLCEEQQLMSKASTSNEYKADAMNLAAKAAALQEEMESKYTSESEKKEFAKALLKEMGNCD
ncbi:MAG: hypothetical protein H0S84_00835 [Bacteroidales bacterium]|nr:hypothetical protein [Bacteroidales bacterium]